MILSASKLHFQVLAAATHTVASNLPCEKPCSSDSCSFKMFKELDKNVTPDFTMPYLSSVTPPLSRVNIHTDAYSAPWTGHEQPYWYRPSYFGWQHVTSASHFTHQSSFLQLKTAPSTEFQLARYYSTKYETGGCHTTEYQTTGCHATEYNANKCHESDYQATDCHANGYQGNEGHATRYETPECYAPGYQATENHATEYQGSGCHATGYQTSDSENRIARRVGGLAYDHGEFPKIISVHSMAESHYTMQENSEDFNAIRSDSVETEPNMSNSFAGLTVPMTGMSNENSTLASSGYKICENTEYHVNNDNTLSNCGSLCNSTTESKVVWNSATENKSTNYSISPVLSSTSKTSAHFCPSQDVGNTNPNEPFGVAGDYDLQNVQLSANKEMCEVTDAENIKMPRCNFKSSSVTDGPPKSDTETTFSTRDAESTSWTHERDLLVKLKKRLTLHRIQRINNLQTRLKHEDKSQRIQLLKKIATLKKEIEHLSNGSSDDVSLSEVYMNIREGNPLNSAPVKMSPSAPNKEMVEGTKEVDSEVSDQTTEVESSSGDMNVNNTMGNSISSDKPDEKLTNSGFRMNVFEKLGFLHGNNQNTPKLSESTNSSADEPKKSQTSQVKASVKNVSEEISKGNGKCYAPQFNLVYSEDSQEWADSENGQILVKSTTITNNEDKLGYSSANNTDILYPELPNSWSSAYVSENHSELNNGREMLKRKQMDVNTLNFESAKRRCKSLPRKVVRKNALETTFDADVYLDEMPLQNGESNELESASSKTEESGDKENGDCKLGTVGDSENIGYDDGNTVIISMEGEDDTLQRNLELRKSKICDLIRKQKGLLQTIEKMATKHQPNDKFSSIP